MTRLTALDPQTASGKTQELFQSVHAKFGQVPNMMLTMGQSPAVLEAYLTFSSILGQTLDAKDRELIALTVAEANGCEYCASAHSVIGKMVGLTADAILAARQGTADNARQAAIIELASALARKRGQISDEEFAAAQAAGLSEGAIAEVVANVALNVFTNYFNNVAHTTIDFPRVPPVAPALTV